MGTCILVKKKMVFGMAKENIHIATEVIILEIGLKEKCKAKDNFMIIKEIYNIKESGKMIIFKEEERYLILKEIGQNMKENFWQEENKDSDNYSLEMEIDIKGNFEMIFLGEKAECLNKMDKLKVAFGKKEFLFDKCDLYYSIKKYK